MKTSGEYLALIKAGDEDELKTVFSPSYPEQVASISYGRLPSGEFGYLRPPTPGASNASSEVVSAADISPESITFSPQAGVFFGTQAVTVSGEGRLRYTLDGSVPTSAAQLVEGPLTLDRSTLIRVGLEVEGRIDEVTTGAFIQLDPSLQQRTSNLPMMVVDAFGDERIDDVERPRQFRPVAGVAFEVDTNSQESALRDTPAYVGRGGLHIRGNSTADYEKKQYSFETWDETDEDTDVSLLGLPAESDWVLHAPFADKTLMRNHLMYRWSNRIGRYAVRTRFVELFLNKDDETVDAGDYVGVYVLMEKVKRGSQRVDVESQPKGENAEQDISGAISSRRAGIFLSVLALKLKSSATNFSSHIRMQIPSRLSSEATCSNILMILRASWSVMTLQTQSSVTRVISTWTPLSTIIYSTSSPVMSMPLCSALICIRNGVRR